MKTALITGASGGIGKEFALIYAKKNYNLVLVARSEDKLERLAANLKEGNNIDTTVIAMDLSHIDSGRKLYAEIKTRGIQIDVLVNNAGFGDYGHFADSDLDRTTEMINLNIATLTELSLLYVKEMKARNSGQILNIASTASFQPIPRFAVYAATKAYVLSLTEALHYELKGTNVYACALCPGPTKTGFEESANMKESKLFERGAMDAKTVAEIGYAGLMKNKMTIIPGFKNKVLAILSNMTPSRKLLIWVSGKIA